MVDELTSVDGLRQRGYSDAAIVRWFALEISRAMVQAKEAEAAETRVQTLRMLQHKEFLKRAEAKRAEEKLKQEAKVDKPPPEPQGHEIRPPGMPPMNIEVTLKDPKRKSKRDHDEDFEGTQVRTARRRHEALAEEERKGIEQLERLVKEVFGEPWSSLEKSLADYKATLEFPPSEEAAPPPNPFKFMDMLKACPPPPPPAVVPPPPRGSAAAVPMAQPKGPPATFVPDVVLDDTCETINTRPPRAKRRHLRKTF